MQLPSRRHPSRRNHCHPTKETPLSSSNTSDAPPGTQEKATSSRLVRNNVSSLASSRHDWRALHETANKKCTILQCSTNTVSRLVGVFPNVCCCRRSASSRCPTLLKKHQMRTVSGHSARLTLSKLWLKILPAGTAAGRSEMPTLTKLWLKYTPNVSCCNSS